MTDGPLGRARRALLDAKERVARKDTPSNREQVELAMAHLDYLLDTLPLCPTPCVPPTTPEAPGVSHPGASVYPHFVVGGEHWPEGGSTYNSTGNNEGVL